ncbi:MAG: hypothetical protein Tsb0013_17580 [Phycisphaerales bacterium]
MGLVEITLGIVMLLLGCLGVLLTLVGLPGTWLYLTCALIAQWVIGTLLGHAVPYTWWTIGAGVLLCVLAEVAEGLSGAAGAAKAGASKRALIGAAVGGLVGAIVGTVVLAFLPIIGTLIGGAIGAGLGAVVLELTKPKLLRKSESLRTIATGAAIGRLLSTVIKSIFAVGLLVLFAITSFL